MMKRRQVKQTQNKAAQGGTENVGRLSRKQLTECSLSAQGELNQESKKKRKRGGNRLRVRITGAKIKI